MNDYIEAATALASKDFHADKAGLFYLRSLLTAHTESGNKIDEIKKALFYGRDLPGFDKTHKWGVGCASIEQAIGRDVLHALIGIITEATEIAEALMNAITDITRDRDGEGAPLDVVNIKEEAGDILWYLALLFKALDTDFEAEARRNISKLIHRYPDGFSEQNALVRDIAGERAILEQGE